MKPRITLLTLGVDDLQKSVAFYRDGLGLRTDGIVGTEFEHGAVAFFELQAGQKLALWPRGSIAHDTGLPVGPRSPTELTIGPGSMKSPSALRETSDRLTVAVDAVDDRPDEMRRGGSRRAFP